MYTLYHFPISCSNAVKIALELIGAEHNTVIVDLLKDEQHSPEFLALNPMGKVPVLVEGEQVMTQGMAMLIHLSQKHPGANLMPGLASNEGMTALKWLDYVATSLHGNFDKVIHPDRIADQHDSVKANAEEQINKQLKHIDSRLSESKFLAGERPTLSDLYFAVILGWGQLLSFDPLQRFPRFSQYSVDLKTACPNSASLQAL